MGKVRTGPPDRQPSEFREIFRQCLKTGEILTDWRRDVCPWIARKGEKGSWNYTGITSRTTNDTAYRRRS